MRYDDSLKRYISFKGDVVAYFKAWFRDSGKLSVVYKKFVQELTIKFFMYNSNCLLHLCLHLQFAVFFREKLMKNL